MGCARGKTLWLEKYWRGRQDEARATVGALRKSGFEEDKDGRKFIAIFKRLVNVYAAICRRQKKILVKEARKRVSR